MKNQGDISKRDIHAGEIQTHVQRIAQEFYDGFKLLSKYPKSVTIFGSSLLVPTDKNYQQAKSLASRIANELDYAIITGGGPGIMEAANLGAKDGNGTSVGLTISLPHVRIKNNYIDDSMHFAYFFSRKAMLTFAAEAYIFFPGGFGTFDELFSILTLLQTDKIPETPVILFDSSYWTPLVNFIEKIMVEKYHTLPEKDLKLFEITDSEDRVLEIIGKTSVRTWSRNIN